jgi:hypothetical protein
MGASVLLKLLLTARVLLANPSPVRHQPGGELGLIRFEHIIVHHYPVLKTDDSPGDEMPPPPSPLGTPTTLTAEVREAKTARLTALRREVRQLESELEEDDARLEEEVLAEAVAARRIGTNGEDRSIPAPREDSGAGRRDDLRAKQGARRRSHEVQQPTQDDDATAWAIGDFAPVILTAMAGGAALWHLRPGLPVAATATEQSGPAAEQLPPGCPVQVQGLARATQTNGKCGTIVGFIADRGRYEVALAGGDRVSLRPENVSVR